MLKVKLSTPCRPTESREKVVAAVRALFPDADLSGDEMLVGESSSLDVFAEALRRQKIRDAARAIMLKGLSGNRIHFRLNKQVAIVGKVSFSEEAHPLGDIEVVIEAEDPRAVIDAVAPSTRETGEGVRRR